MPHNNNPMSGAIPSGNGGNPLSRSGLGLNGQQQHHPPEPPDSQTLAEQRDNLVYRDTGSNFDLPVPHPNVSPNDDKFASKMRANIARAQFEDYKRRFEPIEEELVGEAHKDLEDTNFLGRSTDSAASQFDNAQAQANRERSRFGLGASTNPSTERKSSLDRAASIVGAQNRARDQFSQQQTGILTGGLGSAGREDPERTRMEF